MRVLFFLTTLLCTLSACDRTEPVKDDSPSKLADVPVASGGEQTPPGDYVFYWQVEGKLDEAPRTSRSTIYELSEGGELRELGQVEDRILVGHEAGISEVTYEAHQARGCGACDEADPVAACARGEDALTTFTEDRLLVTLPDGTTKTQALISAPGAGEPTAFHDPRIDYHGQLGPYLFVTYRARQMPCYGDGFASLTEYAVLDTRRGELATLLSPAQMKKAGEGDVAIAAIGQAEAMYEGFDGELSLRAAQFYLDGSEPNVAYFYTASCGEPCTGMVDVEEKVTVELPSVILPDVYDSHVSKPPAALLPVLDAPGPDRLAHGWSSTKKTEASRAKLEALMK